MPELPEVETIARQLRTYLQDRTITGVEVLWERTLDRPAPRIFKDALIGAKIKTIGRRGKYLLITLDNEQVLVVHLRMTGKFLVYAHGTGHEIDPHVRVRFELDDQQQLIFSDTRKFGRLYLVKDHREITGELGPEPLSAAFTAEIFGERLTGHRGEIKRLLLNQHFIAGIGNIYASEALWHAGIHPQRAANTLTGEEAARLHKAIVQTLEESLQNGGTSLSDRQYVYPNGDLGQQQEQLRVYERDGERCPCCGYAIQRIVQGQRSTYFCPVCQKPPQAGHNNL